jgi:hypothetical protein
MNYMATIDPTQAVKNYFEQPGLNGDNALVVTGTFIWQKTQQVKTANYTLLPTDINTTILMTSGSALTLTLEAIANYAVGSVIKIIQGGAGAITVSKHGSDPLLSLGSNVVSGGAGAVMYLEVLQGPAWSLSGDLTS